MITVTGWYKTYIRAVSADVGHEGLAGAVLGIAGRVTRWLETVESSLCGVNGELLLGYKPYQM